MLEAPAPTFTSLHDASGAASRCAIDRSGDLDPYPAGEIAVQGILQADFPAAAGRIFGCPSYQKSI